MPGFRSCTHGFGSLSRFIIVMLSTPPPMAASAPPRMISWAAMAMAWSPDEQKRLTVVPATDAGKPARIAATRATLVPWGPWGWAQPRITSSISAGSSWGTFPSASRMQWSARSSGRVRLNDPRNDLASGVRELATTGPPDAHDNHGLVDFRWRRTERETPPRANAKPSDTRLAGEGADESRALPAARPERAGPVVRARPPRPRDSS